MPPPANTVFLSFSQRIKHQYLTFSVAVHSSLAHVLREVYSWSVAMVTRYDVISRGGQDNFK